MVVNDSKKRAKRAEKIVCKICDYSTCKNSHYERHLETDKHKKQENDSKMVVNDSSIGQKSTKSYECKCGKIYKYDSGYYRHKKKCNIEEKNNTEIVTESTEKNEIYDLVKYLMNENKELKDMMIEQQTKMMEQQNLVLEIAKNGTHNTTHTNSHNKTFNLQIFLNETCKDAMNIMDFVEQIILNLSDLEETGRLGFAEGISKMILNRLKTLDVTERPIHCSDLKRETLYIKDENKWEKEEEGKPILTKAVKEIAGKNIKQITNWQKKYPDYNDPESKTSDKYMNMVMNVMAGGTEKEMQQNYEKVIKNIAKETTINKENFLV
jgi:hypothetical protein